MEDVVPGGSSLSSELKDRCTPMHGQKSRTDQLLRGRPVFPYKSSCNQLIHRK